MKNRIISISVILVLVLVFCSTFTSCMLNEDIPIPEVRQDVFIYDDDNIIDDNVEQNLNQMLVLLEEKTEIEFAVITVQSLNSYSIEDYANNVFNTLGIGKKDKDNGILLLISSYDTKVRLEIGRGLEGCLTDSKCGRILDEFFVSYRDKNDYTQATNLTVQATISVICEEYNITIDGLDTKSIQMEESEELPISTKILIAIGIIIFLVLLELITGHIFGDGFGDGIVFLILQAFSGGSSSSNRFGGGFSGGGGSSR